MPALFNPTDQEKKTNTVNSTSASNPATQERIAGLGRRFCAGVADAVFGLPISIGIVFGSAITSGVPGLYAGVAASTATWWLYSSWAEASSKQSTLGARLFGVRVASRDGGRASFWQVARRQAVRVLLGASIPITFLTGPRELPLVAASVLAASFLFALKNEKRQSVADLAGRTVVTRA